MSAPPNDNGLPLQRPLEVLFERADLPKFELPEALACAYGGAIGFATPRLVANFVASLDGVVGLDDSRESGGLISQNSAPDRFVMGLLRACADAIIVGAGTFRRSPSHSWLPESIWPPAAALFRALRAARGSCLQPQFVLVSGSGEVDVTRPGLQSAWLVTTRRGEARLRAIAPATARVVVLDSEPMRFAELTARLRSEGARMILTEGGPSLFAELVAERLVDELFLTTAPRLFGRYADDQRKSLADGLDLGGTELELLSARRAESQLFLRYALTK